MKKHKAIALFSGGLDSILAVKWMQSRGYTVYPVFFRAPYLSADRAILSAEQNDIILDVVDVSAEHLTLLDKPVYGFGKWLNPCIDCHGFMFRKAAQMLEQKGADFLISGEVLGQRPMSQRRDALESVGRLSGLKDLIVRPLSQLLLPETKPVREGWVEKEDLLSIHGRGRYAQMNLAKTLGVVNFPSPAGGCLLTDRNYCLRLKDLMDHRTVDVDSLELLSFGRHFRLNESLKLIVGRDEKDNIALEKVFKDGWRLLAENMMGPLGLLIGEKPDEQALDLALGIFQYYHTKADSAVFVNIQEFKDGFPVGEPIKALREKIAKNKIQEYQLSYS